MNRNCSTKVNHWQLSPGVIHYSVETRKLLSLEILNLSPLYISVTVGQCSIGQSNSHWPSVVWNNTDPSKTTTSPSSYRPLYSYIIRKISWERGYWGFTLLLRWCASNPEPLYTCFVLEPYSGGRWGRDGTCWGLTPYARCWIFHQTVTHYCLRCP